MWSEVYKYLAVLLSSAFKFIAGPLLGVASGLTLVETIILTSVGMMISVFCFTLAGERFKCWFIKTFYKNRKLFSAKNRRMVKVWRNYGIKGVAFLTPVIFTPILGTLIASSFGEPKKSIFMHMLISSIFWASIFSLFLFALKSGNITELVLKH